jgi:probable HAF family extracellular repeat protein
MKPAVSMLALAALTGAAPIHAAEPATYHCERLAVNDGFAYDINDRGVVAGSVFVGREGWYAAVWRRRKLDTMPQVTGFENAINAAHGINRHGDLAGYVSAQGGPSQAAVWIDGVGQVLPKLANAATPLSEATAINDHGHVVGSSTNAQSVLHATLWKRGRAIDLGALQSRHRPYKTRSYASDINASGMVVGSSESSNALRRAVQWTDGTRDSLVDLGATAYGDESEALAVNSAGVVVGYSTVGDFSQPYRPIGWIGGMSFDLKPFAGADNSAARDINDAGTVVGSVEGGAQAATAIVWPHYGDAPIDLNSLLDADGCRGSSGRIYHLTNGIAINNNGEILAGSFEFPHDSTFRLVPVGRR